MKEGAGDRRASRRGVFLPDYASVARETLDPILGARAFVVELHIQL
jgi:hypothetical protein